MWSWQSEADGIAMAADVKVGVGRFLPVLHKSRHPQRTQRTELQNPSWAACFGLGPAVVGSRLSSIISHIDLSLQH